MDMTFAQKIRELRNKKEWSVYDLAKKIDATPGYISKIEARGEIPSPQMIIKLAELLGAKPEDLIEIAKSEKSEEVSKIVKRKYDDVFAMYRRIKEK
jgi:transcriptional regulator with XRE-family HTH domain